METLEQFMAKQNEALEKKRKELEEFSNVGPVPGLEPWLIHGKLYGSRHIGYKLKNMAAFIEWASATCVPIHAVEGVYKGFYPHVPDTRDYKEARIVSTGDVEVIYSTIMRSFKVAVFVPGFRLSFEVKKHVPELIPRPIFSASNGSRRWDDDARRIDGWDKTREGVRQYLRPSVDKQSAELETLLTWEQFTGFFGDVAP